MSKKKRGTRLDPGIVKLIAQLRVEMPNVNREELFEEFMRRCFRDESLRVHALRWSFDYHYEGGN